MPPPTPTPSRLRRHVSLAPVAALVIGVAALALLLWVGRLDDPYKGYPAAEQFVTLPRGSGLGEIARRLAESGVVHDQYLFRLAVYRRADDRSLKAGEYRFDKPLSPYEVLDRLVRGDVYVRRVTFPEGLTIGDMAGVFEAAGFGPAELFLKAARNVSLVAAWDREARDLEGYLFPDTYALERSANVDDLVERMVARFGEVLGAEARARAQASRRSVREIVTLASLVEKETARDDERATVAGVYVNRLRIGMGLQCDPTVIYALRKAGRYRGNLTRESLTFDSPYNTYRYRGLPPGPIASPGKASLDAALEPARVRYLYFVSRNDGSHVFATTLAEHNRNVRRYQVEAFGLSSRRR